MRIVIAGVPKAGKTSHAATFTCAVRHTDDLIRNGWSEASEEIARTWLTQAGPWVVEGTASVRALRKALTMRAAKPCDAVLYLATPHVELNAGQLAMAKGVEKVWREIAPKLKARGVRVYESVEAMQKAEVT